MHPKKFALAAGIVMLLMGALSLIPSLYQLSDRFSDMTLPGLKLETSYGYFLGAFPMNILNKITLIVFGLAGILASQAKTTNLPKSILFARVTFFVMGAAAVLGVIPETNTLNGYWPLFGEEAWVHGVFAVLGAYFGYALPAAAKRENDRRGPINPKPMGV